MDGRKFGCVVGLTVMLLLTLAGCGGGADGLAGKDGAPGAAGKDGVNGTNGKDGTPGAAGTNGTNGTNGADGTAGVDGTNGVDGNDGLDGLDGPDGLDGHPGLAEGQSPGMDATMTIAAPANGTHFVAGETIVITVTVNDMFKYAIDPADLSQARLMISGPKAVTGTTTAVGLMGASGDYAQPVHHYVKLNDPATPGLAIDGSTLTFTTQAVSTEAAGTYIVGAWLVSKLFPIDQAFLTQEIQIGTATPEPDVVDKANCGSCHLGSQSGKYYFAHIDPGFSPVGNWSIDSTPVTNCKVCHNQAGYAAYTRCSDGSVPDRSVNPPTCATGTVEKASDPIVRRVHGVHMGEELKNAFNTDATNGDFKDYTPVVFPAGVKNCAKCHADDRWKTNASRLACGTCHDAVDFAAGTINPPRDLGKIGGTTACTADADCATPFGADTKCNTTSGTCTLGVHRGNAQADDTLCAGCHNADAVAAKHAPTAPAYSDKVEVKMSAPTNGTHYTSEQPVVTVTVKDSSGVARDPAAIDDATYNTLRLFVHGPRAKRVPVLTSPAAGIGWARAYQESAKKPSAGWDPTNAIDFTVKINGTTTVTVAVPANLKKTGVTADEVVSWLNGDAAFAAVATAVKVVKTGSSAGDYVQIKSDTRGAASSVEIPADAGDVQSIMGFKTTVAVGVPGSYAYADLRLHPADPVEDNDTHVVRDSTAKEIRYTLDAVTSLTPGTYVVTLMGKKASADATSVAYQTFQVGTATEEKKIATNCTDCHGDTFMHGSYPFDVDVCGACHDYRRQYAERKNATDPADGWGGAAASGRSNFGFGAAPISRRAHGVHMLAYLEKPNEVHSSFAAPNNEIIFPQDIRNCQKCHSETDTWKEKPSRLACFACHDSDAAKAHGMLQTYDPTPLDLFSGDEMESCNVCHEAGKEFGVDKVHNVSDPYVPPYPREKEDE